VKFPPALQVRLDNLPMHKPQATRQDIAQSYVEAWLHLALGHEVGGSWVTPGLAEWRDAIMRYLEDEVPEETLKRSNAGDVIRTACLVVLGRANRKPQDTTKADAVHVLFPTLFASARAEAFLRMAKADEGVRRALEEHMHSPVTGPFPSEAYTTWERLLEACEKMSGSEIYIKGFLTEQECAGLIFRTATLLRVQYVGERHPSREAKQ